MNVYAFSIDSGKVRIISELARILNRRQSIVSNDVKDLEGISLIELEKKKILYCTKNLQLIMTP